MVKRILWAIACCICACNVPDPPASTGGVQLEPGPCGRGLVVAASGEDYASTNISLVDFEGATLSDSFLSSGAATAGASAPLSGDVVLPLAVGQSGKVVLLDRQNNTVTWVEPTTAQVTAQLSVSEGANAIPHDYLELDPRKAYVSRFLAGDLWIVDPSTGNKTGQIALPQGTQKPFPDRMLRSGDTVIVVLQRFADGYGQAADGELVGIVSDQVSWQQTLPGYANCGGMDVSPSGKLLAVTCTGVFPDSNSTSEEQIAHSGIVLFDLTSLPPPELRRFAVAAALGEPVGWSVAFVDEDTLLGRAVGDLTSGRADTAFTLALSSGEVRELAVAEPYALGDIRCTPRCAGLCLMADASLGGLRRWTRSLESLAYVEPGQSVGLPPRYLGGF